jgi:hypothetical protein
MWFPKAVNLHQPGSGVTIFINLGRGLRGFTGWPVVVALKNGQVVWKGHPDNLSRRFLDGLAGL